MNLSRDTILVTGGAGFIGANFVQDRIASEGLTVVNYDKLTYAGSKRSLAALENDARHIFIQADIKDAERFGAILREYKPRAVVNFAAESHVDRSIHAPGEFIETNIVGVFHLLHETLAYYRELTSADQESFRFLHVSTDEVYGSLEPDEDAFSEVTPYRPNSPYSASKAASDHLVRAYFHTYGLPVLTTNCSNNYGPFQFPEKLIPLMIFNALSGKDLPVYGDGTNIRDWLYVGDHCSAIAAVLEKGRAGETYNIGGESERKNIDVVHRICDLLDDIRPRESGSYREQIMFVTDRPGHDKRYAIDARKIGAELGWSPAENFESGIKKTIEWYLANLDWVEHVGGDKYSDWIALNYAR